MGHNIRMVSLPIRDIPSAQIYPNAGNDSASW